jgi:hypothetical protein
MILYWSFHDWIQGIHNPIEAWYQELSEVAKFEFDTLLKNLCMMEKLGDWVGFKYLKGEPSKEKIWQLDFRADGRQYRLLGVFGSERKQAVLLIGCYHNPTYTPRDTFATAIKRAKALREKKASTYERKIKLDI